MRAIMSIDIAYIVTALLSLVLGFFVGKLWGRHRGHMDVMKIGLEVKNPEMWELLHFLVVEEKEKETAAIERKSGARRSGGRKD
jgi:hypothetical protein